MAVLKLWKGNASENGLEEYFLTLQGKEKIGKRLNSLEWNLDSIHKIYC